MRVRRKKWTAAELSTNKYLIHAPREQKSRWHELFGSKNPIHAEIGCGKGSFIVESARRYPDINFIGIEKEPSVIASAIRLARENGEFKNLRLMTLDASLLTECFEKGELSRIYLNFSDPWGNKKKWAKRRLTHRGFLTIYEQILSPVEIILKTDDRQFFDFSSAEFTESGYTLSALCNDLHKSPYAADNIETEYEKRFAAEGKPINRLVAKKPVQE